MDCMSAENGVACGGICAAAHGNDSKKATTVAGIALVRSFTSLSLYGFGWTTERSRQQCKPRRADYVRVANKQGVMVDWLEYTC